LFALRFDLSLVNCFVAVSPPFKPGSQSVAIALSSLDLVLGCVSELTGGSVVQYCESRAHKLFQGHANRGGESRTAATVSEFQA
jgi:hypothetical protein